MAATLHFHFREHWRDLKRGRPGSRFVERYRRARQEDRQRGPWHRVALIAAGVVCLLIAAILTVIPGPAIPFYFLGGGLLATESRVIARFMDWAEVQLRKVIAWGKRRWRQLPKFGRVAVLVLGACCSVAGAYFSIHLLRG
jgi:hypothetical protein